MGQTEIEFMDLESQELLREEILTLLGMTHSPSSGDRGSSSSGSRRLDLRNMGNHTVDNEKTLIL